MSSASGSVSLNRVAECRRVEDLDNRNAPDGYGLRTKTPFVLLLVRRRRRRLARTNVKSDLSRLSNEINLCLFDRIAMTKENFE